MCFQYCIEFYIHRNMELYKMRVKRSENDLEELNRRLKE